MNLYLIVVVVLINMVSVKGELQVRPNSINMNRLQLSGFETSLLVVRQRHIPEQHSTFNSVLLITLYFDSDQNREPEHV